MWGGLRRVPPHPRTRQRSPAFKGRLAPAPPGPGAAAGSRGPVGGGPIMSDTTRSESKSPRPAPSRAKPRPKSDTPPTDEARPAEADDEFAAGIVDEGPAAPAASEQGRDGGS